MRRRIRLLTPGLAALVACATPTLELAVPATLPTEIEGRVEATVVTLELPEAALSVEVQEAAPLFLWITIEPRRGALELDPMGVRVNTRDGSLPLMSFLGPAEPWISPRAIYRGSGPRIYDFGWAYSKVDVFVATVGVLAVFALLGILGISESAAVARAIFVFHIATLTLLTVACAIFVLRDPSLLIENWQLPRPESLPHAIFFRSTPKGGLESM